MKRHPFNELILVLSCLAAPAVFAADCFESRQGASELTPHQMRNGLPSEKCSPKTGAVLWWGDPYDGTAATGEMPAPGDYSNGRAVVRPREEQLSLIEACGVACHNGTFPPPPKDKNPRELARAIATPDAPWHYVDVSARLEVGPRISEGAGYGIDTLSIGGHSLATESTEFDEIHYLKPGGKAGVHARDGFTPDFALALTRPIELHEQTFELTLGAAEPFIPGASLRGPLRHTSSRLRRRENAPIVDPITGDTYIETPDPATVDDVSALFGTSNAAKVNRASAALLVRDGYLVDKHWLAAWFQHHAEDEFTGGVYGDSKFDRTALVTGTFEIRMVIEARSRKDADRHLALLRRALALAERGHVAVGGGEWRGRGWIAWTQVQFKRFTAGSDEAEKADPSSADPPTASERAA